MDSDSDSDYSKLWVEWFLLLRGNEFFCEVDEDYIRDKFNLTGLGSEVPMYSSALDLLNDSLDEEFEPDMKQEVEREAAHLYGLIQARYIITSRGLQKMVRRGRGECGDIGIGTYWK